MLTRRPVSAVSEGENGRRGMEEWQLLAVGGMWVQVGRGPPRPGLCRHLLLLTFVLYELLHNFP